jgi:hypothetical protein
MLSKPKSNLALQGRVLAAIRRVERLAIQQANLMPLGLFEACGM